MQDALDLIHPRKKLSRRRISNATLIVCPDGLVEHWQQQVAEHFDPHIFPPAECVYITDSTLPLDITENMLVRARLVVITFRLLSNEHSYDRYTEIESRLLKV